MSKMSLHVPQYTTIYKGFRTYGSRTHDPTDCKWRTLPLLRRFSWETADRASTATLHAANFCRLQLAYEIHFNKFGSHIYTQVFRVLSHDIGPFPKPHGELKAFPGQVLFPFSTVFLPYTNKRTSSEVRGLDQKTRCQFELCDMCSQGQQYKIFKFLCIFPSICWCLSNVL